VRISRLQREKVSGGLKIPYSKEPGNFYYFRLQNKGSTEAGTFEMLEEAVKCA